MQLLVSVRNGIEAREAIDGGADVIDVKEPLAGPLGKAGLGATLAVAEAVRGSPRPVRWTIACGELAEGGAEAAAAHAAAVVAAMRRGGPLPWLVKVGLAATESIDWERELLDLEGRLPEGVAQACVVYADWQRCGAAAPNRVVELAGRLAGRTLLIDTFDKRDGSVFEIARPEWLRATVALARSRGLRLALAGRLGLADAGRIAAVAPDIVAVRSAACGGDRLAAVRAPSVEAARRVLCEGRIQSPMETAR